MIITEHKLAKLQSTCVFKTQ